VQAVFGKDPREYSVMTKEFLRDEKVGRKRGKEARREEGRDGRDGRRGGEGKE